MKLLIALGLVALTGCASVLPDGMAPRPEADLNHFIIDCNHKEEQIEFLQSLRPTLYQKQMKILYAGGKKSNYEDWINHTLQKLSYCRSDLKYPKAPQWVDD
jgi:hypothetical protein